MKSSSSSSRPPRAAGVGRMNLHVGSSNLCNTAPEKVGDMGSTEVRRV